MIRKLTLLALFGTFTFLFGCASTGMYMDPKNCTIDPTGSFFNCYYVKDGQVLSYRKPFNSRPTTNKPQENDK